MKKIILLLAIGSMAILGCKKTSLDNEIVVADPILGCTDPNSLNYKADATQDDGTCQYIEQKNRAILLDFSETWCPPCGAYGGPSFDSCLFMENSVITAMKVYESSSPASMNCSLSAAFMSDYQVTGVPDFYVNGTGLYAGGGVSASISSNYNSVKSKANAFANQTVLAGINLQKSIDGSNMNISSKVLFYQPQPAGKAYHLAVYVVEDKIIASQKVSTASGTITNTGYMHRNLLRAGNAATYKGVKINTTAAIEANKRFDNTFTIALNSAWNKANLKVIGVLWEVPATGKPTVVNTVMAK